MAGRKAIGLVFVEGFADWEFGFLSGSAAEWFGGRTFVLTPAGSSVTSHGGVSANGQRSIDPEDNGDLDAVAVIGSDQWTAENPPDVGPLLHAVSERGGVVGAICAGTLALARAGLFSGRAHTSNGRDWILGKEPNYAGAEHYRDVPHAVADGRLISAPGSAPGTFAVEFLGALYPERTGELAQMRKIFGSEYRLEPTSS